MTTIRVCLSRSVTAIIIIALVLSNLHLSTYAANVKGVKIDKNNFPDDNFRRIIAGSDYDRDGNGYLDDKEIGLTINIYCEGMGIKSIKGVEFFTALQGLWCKDNKIKTMDLSNNKDLRGVWCSGNQYTSLDFSDNPELLWVYCYDCNLTSLNVSDNPKMAFIECNTNPLKELDVSKNPELEHLTCGTCELSELDLSNNTKLTHLDAFSNKLTRLDISNCPKMKRLDIWNNKGLKSIDISHNPGLQFYNCAYNDADSIDVSKNPELNKLICSYNDIKKLDLSNNPKLVYLDCACNEISELDLSHNINLHFLQAFTNAFTTLDIGNNPYLVKAYKEGVKKNESKVCKGHSWTIDFGGETSTGEDNIYFLCFDDAVKLCSELKANANNTKKDIEYSDLDSGIPNEEYVTRELVAETLYEMAGCPVAKGIKSKFSDVEAGSWYENAVIWGENNHICIGSPDISSDTFGVGKWITREDFALMMMRYSECMGYKRAIDFGRSDDYLDYYDIDYYAWEAITWVATWNIMSGKGGETKDQQKIEPHGRVTFAELKEILKNMLSVNDISAEVTIPEPADTNIDYSVNTIVRDYKTNAYYKVTS
ncbi:MAG: leucine-rich repeat domain-containing protein, partial [Lachnospiraceae bacterium]|nr:leucine-rich repeat domain-containing protein [Lachnospiraceae bacterium]